MCELYWRLKSPHSFVSALFFVKWTLYSVTWRRAKRQQALPWQEFFYAPLWGSILLCKPQSFGQYQWVCHVWVWERDQHALGLCIKSLLSPTLKDLNCLVISGRRVNDAKDDGGCGSKMHWLPRQDHTIHRFVWKSDTPYAPSPAGLIIIPCSLLSVKMVVWGYILHVQAHPYYINNYRDISPCSHQNNGPILIFLGSWGLAERCQEPWYALVQLRFSGPTLLCLVINVVNPC